MTEFTVLHYLERDDNRIAYRKFGNGPITLLAFHGFGQDGQVFSSFTDLPADPYTLYAIDLFYHGNSQRSTNQLLTKADWHGMIGAFLLENSIDRFDLLGYSLGGRFALALVEAFSDRTDQLILLAPDGITRSIWYRLATGSELGRALFRYGLGQLTVVHQLGHALTRLGLLNRTVMRFAEMSLATPAQRQLVYQTWTRFRLIQPDLARISRLLTQKPIRIRFFTGAFDRIVPGQFIEPLTKRLRQYELTVLRTGHNHLIDLVSGQLTQSTLNHPPQANN